MQKYAKTIIKLSIAKNYGASARYSLCSSLVCRAANCIELVSTFDQNQLIVALSNHYNFIYFFNYHTIKYTFIKLL